MQQLVDLLSGAACDVTPRLLGCSLRRTINGQTILAKIVEVEAYNQTDAASHSFKGKTTRNEVMFGPAGHLYVYFTYGMHYCCNIVTGVTGEGSAVLIRAVEPLNGEDLMRSLRPVAGVQVSNGPAKLCQALSVDTSMNGHDITQPPLELILAPKIPEDSIVSTPRIGISRAKDLLWRFYIKDNPYVTSVRNITK